MHDCYYMHYLLARQGQKARDTRFLARDTRFLARDTRFLARCGT